MPAKPIRIAIVAVVLAAVAAGAWLLAARPRPTALGWPAVMITVAGNGERGFTDGAAGMARFSDPFAVAIDAKGALYVADAGATNRIRKIHPDGRTSTLPGRFDTPSGVAVDAKGNVYVADTGSNRIAKVSRDGAVTTLAGDGAAGFRDGAAGQAQFNGPIGVAVGKDGEVYVADTYNDRIRLISPQGQVTTLAGGESPGFSDGAGAAAAFDRPCGLVLNRDGALLIADAGNDAIRKLGKDGRVTTLARAGSDPVSAMMKGPVGVAVTADNYVYIASFRRGRILQLSPTGELRILVGRDASNPANRQLRLTRPAGLAIDRRGALYVAETATFAIRKLARAAKARPRPRRPRTWRIPRRRCCRPRPCPGRWRRRTPGMRWWATWARCAAKTMATAATTCTPASTCAPTLARRCWRSPRRRSRARSKAGRWMSWARACRSTR